MVLADLPYGMTRQKTDKAIDLHVLWKQYNRITKPDAAVLLFAKPPFDKIIANSNLDNYRYDWIWHKSRATGHLNANRMPLSAHENICVFYRKPPLYNPQKTTGHKPVHAFYTRSSGDNYGLANSLVSGGGNTERYPRSVINFKPVNGKNSIHPNQKPVELLKYLICTYTEPGQTVLDNTAGSGSTIEACIDTGRYGIGIEKDESMFILAIDRLWRITDPV